MKRTFKVHIVQCRDSTEEYAVRVVGWQIQEERKANAGINLTGYHPPPPEADPRAIIFSVKTPALETAFQYKTPVPGSKKRKKTPGNNLPTSNDEKET